MEKHADDLCECTHPRHVHTPNKCLRIHCKCEMFQLRPSAPVVTMINPADIVIVSEQVQPVYDSVLLPPVREDQTEVVYYCMKCKCRIDHGLCSYGCPDDCDPRTKQIKRTFSVRRTLLKEEVE